MDMQSIVGAAAAVCTTVSYFPQLKKCWQTGEAEDLSLQMFTVLSLGIALWIVYGVMKADWIIVAANSVSLACLLAILYFKLRKG